MKKSLSLICLALFAFASQSAKAVIHSGVDGNINWNLDTETSVLTLSGVGDMNNYWCPYGSSVTTAPWGVCHALIKEVEISMGVTSIGNYAFESCSSLTSVTIPESVTSIGEYAFDGCSSLTSVTIPEGVTSIGDEAFYGCTGLTSVTIPESVTSIGEDAFGGCSSLTSVTIPESVTSIGDAAFYGCTGLTSVTIPEGVTSIGDAAFYGCTGLTSVMIPESVTSIGEDAFAGCSCLTSVTIPEGVMSIGYYAFGGCSSLTSVTIPEGVMIIGARAFNGCKYLENVTIPESVTIIGTSCFGFCDDMTSIQVESGNLYYDSRNNCNAIIETASNTLIAGCLNTVIPKDVTTIGDKAFHGCIGLMSVTIPEGVTSIGESAFRSCSNLTSVAIPEGVTSIGNYAFEGCSSLTSVTIEGATPCVGYLMFPSCTALQTIYVPYGASDAYKSAEGWSKYADKIVEMEPEMQQDNLLYMENCKTFHKSQLTIPVLMKNAQPFTAFQCDITLPEGLTLHKTMNEDDEEVFDIAYGSRAKSSHSLLSNQMANGNIRVVGYSSSNSDYRDSEGVLINLTVDVADDASGDLPIKLSNVILTSATDGDTNCPDMQAVLTIIPGQPGDVNGDGKLTMGDVVKLVNHILEVSQTGFNADLADVNEDGKVTMGDVVFVLNMILSGDSPNNAVPMRQPTVRINQESNELDVVL